MVIGPGNGQIFDWEPTLASAAEVMTAHGSDPRLEERTRATRAERKAAYHEWMDAKAAAREQLEQERLAGLWRDADEAGAPEAGNASDTAAEDDAARPDGENAR